MDIENKKEFVSYIEAKEIVKRFSIKNKEDWKLLYKKENNKLRIPSRPDSYYKNEWNGWYEFFGKINKINLFLTYDEAVDFIKEFKVKTSHMYREFQKEHDNLPSSPDSYYKNEWNGWYEFLGNFKKRDLFLTYDEAVDLIKKSNIKTSYMYKEFQKEHDNLPSNPNSTYDEWESWDVFLSSNRLSQSSKVEKIIKKSLENVLDFGNLLDKTNLVIGGKRISLDMADFGRQLAIEYDGSRWHQNSVNKERDHKKNLLLESNGWTLIRIREEPLPKINDKMDLIIDKKLLYSKNDDFIHLILDHLYAVIDNPEIREKIKILSDVDFSKYDYLDIDKGNNYLSYEECKDFALKNGIKSSNEWKSFLRKNDYPNIPIHIDRFYRNNGWESWYKFLDKDPENVFSFISYEDCQKIALDNNIQSSNEWSIFIKENKIENIPSNPDSFYKNSGEWVSWYEFFKKPKKDSFISYDDCKKLALENNIKSSNEWIKFCKEKKPDNVPSTPDQFYKNSGEWISWFEFLNTTPNNVFVSYLEAKEIVKKYSIKSKEAWKLFKRENSELMIPSHPDKHYKNDWKGWGVFLDKKPKHLKKL